MGSRNPALESSFRKRPAPPLVIGQHAPPNRYASWPGPPKFGVSATAVFASPGARADGKRARAGGAPALAPSAAWAAGADPIMVHSYGHQTNASIAYAKVMRRYVAPLMVESQLSQLILEMKEESDVLADNAMSHVHEHRRYSLLNVPAWNYMQAATQSKPAARDKVKSAEQVWNNWAVAGVVRAEHGQDEPGGDMRDLGAHERMLVLTVAGYASVRNGWGENLKPFARLYLLLKQQKLPAAQRFVLSEHGHGLPRKPRTDRPFQLSFWADNDHEYPPLEALEYRDDFGQPRIGKAVKVGIVERGEWWPADGVRQQDDVGSSALALLARPLLWIHVDPGM